MQINSKSKKGDRRFFCTTLIVMGRHIFIYTYIYLQRGLLVWAINYTYEAVLLSITYRWAKNILTYAYICTLYNSFLPIHIPHTHPYLQRKKFPLTVFIFRQKNLPYEPMMSFTFGASIFKI